MSTKKTGKAVGTKVEKVAKGGRQTLKATPTVSKSSEAGYKGHNAGSRKGEVHEAFDARGVDAARALGAKLGLKPGTLASWCGTWGRAKAKPAPVTKGTQKGATNAQASTPAKADAA